MLRPNLHRATTYLHRKTTMRDYKSGDPIVGPRVQSARAPAAPPTQLDAGAFHFLVYSGPRLFDRHFSAMRPYGGIQRESMRRLH